MYGGQDGLDLNTIKDKPDMKSFNPIFTEKDPNAD